MRDRKLKNYKKYWKRLINFANAIGVSVVYSDTGSLGEWLAYVRKIRLDEDLSNSLEIACFLHELGHAIDDIFYKKYTINIKLASAYIASYDYKADKPQLKLVLQCEKRAWANGKIIAKRLKIPLGTWYNKVKESCLRDYRKT